MAKLLQLLTLRRTGDGNGTRLDAWRSTLLGLLNAVKFIIALLAVGSLVAEYGFYLSEEWTTYTSLATRVVLYGFAIQAFVKLLIVADRKAHLRSRWGELSVFVLILWYLLFPGQLESLLLSFNPLLTPEAITTIYLATTQVFVVLALLPATLRASKRIMARNIQPSMLILLSFLALILVGTGLLSLPKATVSQSFSFVDALFTATSAVTTTGLIVVDTNTYFTRLGHVIIIVLLQIGGLGIMTLTTFFGFIVGGTRLKEYSTLQSLFEQENVGRIKRTIILIALLTLAFEALGALGLYWNLSGTSFEHDGFFFSVFHSISAFCTGGFSLTTENLLHTELRLNTGFLIMILVLIVGGSIGFPIFSNLGAVLSGVFKRQLFPFRFSVHTKLALLTTIIIYIAGSIFFYFLENDHTLDSLTLGQQVLSAFFQIVTASSTAGFNTLDIGAVGVPMLLLFIFIMWIGGSPASTAGGIKTTSFTLSLLNIYSVVSGRNKVEIFRKRVADMAIVKAFSTVIVSFLIIGGALFLLLLTEDLPLQSLLFEVVSALSTVGLSTGITPMLSSAGKLTIILCMFVGRVGLLAVLVAITRQRDGHHYEYTQENVLVT